MQRERRPAVSKEEVEVACSKLAAEGKPVTASAVIKMIGGSFTKVGVLVRTWRNEQASASTVVLEMPDTVLEAIQKAGSEIWQMASQAAAEDIDRIKSEANTKVNAAIQEREEYEAEVQRLETALDEAYQLAETAKADAKSVADLLAESRARIAAIEANLADRDREIARQQEQFERLEKRNEALQAELVNIAKLASTTSGNTEGKSK